MDVILAAGGTGGHLFPAEALAQQLSQRKIVTGLITDKRCKGLASLSPDSTWHINAGGIAGMGLIRKARNIWELFIGLGQARRLLKTIKPRTVVGFGGYAAFPTVLAAITLRIPVILHEQNAVLGRANKFLALFAHAIAGHLPLSQPIKNFHLIGNPVRPAVLANQHQKYTAPTETGPIHLLITGGSGGARIFSDVVPLALTGLPTELRQRLHVTQQCRPEDIDRVRAFYDQHQITAQLASFFDNMPDLMADSHLVICRSGAGTLSELAVIGRPAILVPYAYAIDDHQTANARIFINANGGWLISQTDLNPDALSALLANILSDTDSLVRAAAHAKAFGHPDAATKLANLVCQFLA